MKKYTFQIEAKKKSQSCVPLRRPGWESIPGLLKRFTNTALNDNPMPSRLLTPIDCSKIPALISPSKYKLYKYVHVLYKYVHVKPI
jgi:hypothetical protein